MSKFAAMLAAEPDQPLAYYIKHDEWCLMQKFDGHRLLLYIHDDGQILAMNRNGEEFKRPLGKIAEYGRKQFRGWWFDGEWMNPDEYRVFDVLKTHSDDAAAAPYEERVAHLRGSRFGSNAWYQPIRPVHPVLFEFSKQREFEILEDGNVEGVIFRNLHCPYSFGKRGADAMVKWKFWKTIDVVAYNIGREGKNSIGVAVITDDGPVDVGAVTVQPRMLDTIKVMDVLEVKYLYATDSNRLYQPSLLRVRDDKDPLDCGMDQLRYTNKTLLTPSEESSRQPASQAKMNGAT